MYHEKTIANYQVIGKMVRNPRFDVAIFEPCDTEWRPATHNDVFFSNSEFYRLVETHKGFTTYLCTPEVQAYYSEFILDVRIGLEELRRSLAFQNRGEEKMMEILLSPLVGSEYLPVENFIAGGLVNYE